ncbi:aldo/keto reductase [Streptococcus sp. NLN64]|uniref:aldo/keto reductase n=1 Tax=Streptococcus sp. NLN64 TaxID=2822799 RepID=UPI0018CBB4FA|nr:aldo/keto reductase [Streptococcus sp. NLN64]MBG9368253.1 aldo/keto reductase [Streptococcus sp. NLN64]
MKTIEFAQEKTKLSSIVLGLMRIKNLSPLQVEELIETALSVGINTFDLADIYGGGRSEEILGQVLKNRPDLRNQMWIQSKCGIRIEDFTYFDFSKEHILNSVEGILQRLHIDQLNSLLLHRPDVLMEPEEVAEAFDHLEKTGKVRHFGVSNQNPMMIELLKTAVSQPLAINHLQLSAAFAPEFDAGFHVNMEQALSSSVTSSIFEYARTHDMVIQAWSVLQHGYFQGVFVGDPKFEKLNQVLNRLANHYQTTPSAIAIAWVLRYPAKMQAIIGTTQPQRILEATQATNLTLSRKEWYEIYLAAGKTLP